MNRKFIFLPILLLFGLFLASCTSTDNNPVTPAPTGSVYVTSTPSAAAIWVDGVNSNKVTPDTITNLSTGNHSFILKLTDYFNDTVTVNVAAGSQSLNRTLAIDKSITAYGPVQAWESADPSAADPSGFVLKSGQAVSIGTSTYGPVDVYYSSNGYVVATAYGLHNNTGRSTSFFVGTSNVLTDGVASPLAINSWVTQVLDTETNYFFLFDADSHYSKMIITERGGGTVGVPAWIKVKWLYNNKPNDQRS